MGNQATVSHNLSRRDAVTVVPFPLQVAAAVSWRLLAVIGMAVAAGYVLLTLRGVVVPLAVALLLTALLGPVVNWLVKYRLPRGLATLIVLVAGLALIGGLLAFVIAAFMAGLPDLSAQVGRSLQQILAWLQHSPFGFPPVTLHNVLDSLSRSVSNNRNLITTGALSAALTVGHYLSGAALALFALIYFLYGGGSIWRFLLSAAPRSARDRIDVAGQRSYAALVGFIRATVLVAVVDAVGIGIGLVAVGAPLVVPLVALTFLAAFIPVIGTVVSGLVAVLVVLMAKGPVSALIVLGVVIGVQQCEGNVLQPLLMSRAVKLNGMAVVLAVAVGTAIAGIAGALLAVPLLGMLNTGIRTLISVDARSDNLASRSIKAANLSHGVEENGAAVNSAFPPMKVPVNLDSSIRNGASVNRIRSRPAHRRR